MTHEYWWIIHCGGVGAEGEATSPGQWMKHSKGFVAFKASSKELENIVKPHAKKIAEIIGELTGAHVHKMDEVAGGYCGIGIGKPESLVDIPALANYADMFLTVIMDAKGESEADVSAAYAKITIERAKAYLKVHERTGGVIHFQYADHDEP